jgi:hypothetical protein
MDVLIKIISHNFFWTAVTIAVGIITTATNYKLKKDMQKEKIVFEERMEVFKSNSAKNLQIDNYFRNISGQELKEVFDFWSSIIFLLGKQNNLKELSKFTQKTFMYGSVRTVKILSKFQQEAYNIKYDKNSENDISNIKSLIYAACIVCSLKSDFSGVEINPLTILEIKLEDFYERKNEFIKYYNEILDELKD